MIQLMNEIIINIKNSINIIIWISFVVVYNCTNYFTLSFIASVKIIKIEDTRENINIFKIIIFERNNNNKIIFLNWIT
jgi:hypothetical protein